MLRVFIKKSELANPSPTVLASYPETAVVATESHGTNVVNFLVAERFVRGGDEIPPRQYLTEDWRAADTALDINPVMQAEARRRIEAVFPADQRAASLYELVDLVLKHGVDTHNWPGDAVARRAEIDRFWHYVRDVNDAAKSQHAVPHDPTDDSHWPTRIT